MQPAIPQHPGNTSRTGKLHGSSAARGDRIFALAAQSATLIVIALLLAVMVLLFIDARLAIQTFGFSFFTSTTWDPVFQNFGAAGFIFGTLVTSSIALLIATPVAAGAAIFIVEYAPPWLRNPVSFTVEMLAAIPSIIYGLWGFFVLAPLMRNHVSPQLQSIFEPVPVVGALFAGPIFGKDILTAGVILAIMILPTIMAVSREVVMTVPDTQREGMLALGATRWEMIRNAVLPYAKVGIFGGAILGLARALGETMAVTMVIGNSNSGINASLFTPGYTMASSIALQFREADTAMYFSAVVNIGLVLLLISALVNILARILIWSFSRGTGDTRL
jgi:phosphate transport system permease protein